MGIAHPFPAQVALFIFKDGDAYLEGEACDGPAGDVDLLPGDSFGELCVLGIENDSDVTVTTRAKSEFFYVRRDGLLGTFEHLPEIMSIMERKKAIYSNSVVHSRGKDGSSPRSNILPSVAFDDVDAGAPAGGGPPKKDAAASKKMSISIPGLGLPIEMPPIPGAQSTCQAASAAAAKKSGNPFHRASNK